MTGLFMLALSIILLQYVWRQWKKAMRDDARDRLFELRERVRDYFVQSGRPLDGRVYRQLWDYLNHHLTRLEDYSFLKTVLLSRYAPRHPEFLAYVDEMMARLFSTNDPELEKFIRQTTDRTARIVSKCIMDTSMTVTAARLVFASVELVSPSKSEIPILDERERIKKTNIYQTLELKYSQTLKRPPASTWINPSEMPRLAYQKENLVGAVS